MCFEVFTFLEVSKIYRYNVLVIIVFYSIESDSSDNETGDNGVKDGVGEDEEYTSESDESSSDESSLAADSPQPQQHINSANER